MGFLAMYPLIRLAKWADITLDTFNEVEHYPLLMMSGMQTDRTAFTDLRQRPIQGSNVSTAHYFSSFPTEKALPSNGPTLW